MQSFFFSSRRRHTRCGRDWSSDVCSSDLEPRGREARPCTRPLPDQGGRASLPGRRRLDGRVHRLLAPEGRHACIRGRRRHRPARRTSAQGSACGCDGAHECARARPARLRRPADARRHRCLVHLARKDSASDVWCPRFAGRGCRARQAAVRGGARARRQGRRGPRSGPASGGGAAPGAVRCAARLARARSHRLSAARSEGQSGVLPALLDARPDRQRSGVDDQPERRGPCVTRVGIVAKPDAPRAKGVIAQLLSWLSAQGLGAVLEKETADLASADAPAAGKAELPSQVDLLIVLGGDGTLLSMARAVGDLGVPLLGVNLGGLGFLTATTLDEMFPALEAYLGGHMVIEERMLLAARIVRTGQTLGEYAALNDVVITKSAMSRIIDLSVSVEGRYATAYRADGLIISTPTGSTAYSLSAGGPILFPTMDAVVITPICSHTLTNRPIVLPGTQRIELTLRANQEVMMTVDGQVGFGLREDDVVETQRAAARIRLVRFPHKHFFSVLRTKLKWGER